MSFHRWLIVAITSTCCFLLNSLAEGEVDLSSFCSHKHSSGYYPHPDDCSKFISCVDVHGSIQMCPGGTHYNSITGLCDLAHKVNCNSNGHSSSSSSSRRYDDEQEGSRRGGQDQSREEYNGDQGQGRHGSPSDSQDGDKQYSYEQQDRHDKPSTDNSRDFKRVGGQGQSGGGSSHGATYSGETRDKGGHGQGQQGHGSGERGSSYNERNRKDNNHSSQSRDQNESDYTRNRDNSNNKQYGGSGDSNRAPSSSEAEYDRYRGNNAPSSSPEYNSDRKDDSSSRSSSRHTPPVQQTLYDGQPKSRDMSSREYSSDGAPPSPRGSSSPQQQFDNPSSSSDGWSPSPSSGDSDRSS